MSQLPKINLYNSKYKCHYGGTYTYVYLPLALFLWRTLIHTMKTETWKHWQKIPCYYLTWFLKSHLIKYIYISWKVVKVSPSVMSNSLQPHGLYCPWNSLGQNTGVGSLSLLQGIFLTQESNPGLPHCRQILYQLSHQGSPRQNQLLIILIMCFSKHKTVKLEIHPLFLNLTQGKLQ